MKKYKKILIVNIIIIVFVVLFDFICSQDSLLSNEEVISYSEKRIDTLLDKKNIPNIIRSNLNNQKILCDSFRVSSYDYYSEKISCSDTFFLVKKITGYLMIDLVINIHKNYIIFYFVPQHGMPNNTMRGNDYEETKKGKYFGVIFSYYKDKPLKITHEMFPDFEIVWGEKRPTRNEKWIYIIDKDWAIYVP